MPPDSRELEHHHRAGIVLLQAGSYWEAHEAWEYCWRSADPPESTWYKGLIQAAAALEQWRRGNQRGLLRNWEKARVKLIDAPASWRGVDIVWLVVAMDRFTSGEDTRVAPVLIVADTPPRETSW